MSNACAPRDTLNGFVDVLLHLVHQLGVVIDYTPMSDEHVAHWDPDAWTLRVRETASLEDQLWLMDDLRLLLTVGPYATSAISCPTKQLPRQRCELRLVPEAAS